MSILFSLALWLAPQTTLNQSCSYVEHLGVSELPCDKACLDYESWPDLHWNDFKLNVVMNACHIATHGEY